MKTLPRSKTGFGPYEILKAPMHTTVTFIFFRPVLVVFSLALLLFVYLAISNRKIQNALLSLPYDRLYRNIKSDKMITFYATVLEVVFEVLTAVILAGVSVLITSWLLLEEVADRKHQKPSMDMKSHGGRPADLAKQNPSKFCLKIQEGDLRISRESARVV